MEEWTEEFVLNVQSELRAMVNDWKYDFGAGDRECSTMLIWMAIRLNPDLAREIDVDSLSARLSS